MPFPRNAEKYLHLDYVGSLGAELGLSCVLVTQGWRVEHCGTVVNPAVTAQAYLDNPALSLIFQSSNELCCRFIAVQSPHHIPLGQKKSIRSQNSFQIPELLTTSLKSSSGKKKKKAVQSKGEKEGKVLQICKILQICSAQRRPVALKSVPNLLLVEFFSPQAKAEVYFF